MNPQTGFGTIWNISERIMLFLSKIEYRTSDVLTSRAARAPFGLCATRGAQNQGGLNREPKLKLIQGRRGPKDPKRFFDGGPGSAQV